MTHPSLPSLLDILAPTMDACGSTDKPKTKRKVIMDAAEKEVEAEAQFLAQDAVKAFLSLAELDDSELDEGENMGDRLMNLIVGLVDENKDGEITDEEAVYIDIARAAIGEYCSTIGCNEDDISAMLNDFDNDATERCISCAAGELGEGEDIIMDSARTFAFDSLDCTGKAVTMDATYKKMLSLIGGVKKWVKKRVSGSVRLSSKMKAHLKKLAAKPRSSSWLKKMSIGMKKQFKMGLAGK